MTELSPDDHLQWIDAWRRDAEQRFLEADGDDSSPTVVAVISDVHANLSGLMTVLRSAWANGATEVWCLGDVVGRGPNAAECVEVLSRLGRILLPIWLMGNHEAAMLSLPSAPRERMDANSWNIVRRHQADCQRFVLVTSPMPGLMRRSWPDHSIRETTPGGPVAFAVHGGGSTPDLRPAEVENQAQELTTPTEHRNSGRMLRYVDSPDDAADLYRDGMEVARVAGKIAPLILLAGHTHVPRIFEWRRIGTLVRPEAVDPVLFGHEYTLGDLPVFLNPGTCGGWSRDTTTPSTTYILLTFQPAMSSYMFVQCAATYDAERLQMRSLGYPERTSAQLHDSAAGTPVIRVVRKN